MPKSHSQQKLKDGEEYQERGEAGEGQSEGTKKNVKHVCVK